MGTDFSEGEVQTCCKHVNMNGSEEKSTENTKTLQKRNDAITDIQQQQCRRPAKTNK